MLPFVPYRRSDPVGMDGGETPHALPYISRSLCVIPATPQDFRDRAAECERLAATMQEPAARETLLYVASRWRAIADADERGHPAETKDASPPSLG